jgi:hypothetical protein
VWPGARKNAYANPPRLNGEPPREPKGLYHPRFKSLGMRDWPTRQAEVNECKRLITTSIEYSSVSQCCKISPLARKVT